VRIWGTASSSAHIAFLYARLLGLKELLPLPRTLSPYGTRRAGCSNGPVAWRLSAFEHSIARLAPYTLVPSSLAQETRSRGEMRQLRRCMPREPSYRPPFDPSLRSLGTQRPIADQPPTAFSLAFSPVRCKLALDRPTRSQTPSAASGTRRSHSLDRLR
jgi:hypothetical protein